MNEVTQDHIEEALDHLIENIDEKDEKGNKIKITSEQIWKNLTLRQKKFCQLYALDIELMGNGALTYAEVYDIDRTKKWWYNVVCAAASRLLRSVKTCDYINSLLEEQWLNDQFMDKQLLYLATQHDDKVNKMSAIREYNRLKGRWLKENKSSTDQLVDALISKILWPEKQ